jgi:hypothetical protein
MDTTKIISFGYRCSSAGFLKKMGLKHESFPFDWLISRLSVIKHCIETNFTEFLNLQNYEKRQCKTYEMTDINNNFVCDENLIVNTYYQPLNIPNPEIAYKWYLAMNHHNILENEKHKEYYNRCIHRFQEVIKTENEKFFLHICPLILLDKYNEIKDEIKKSLDDFDDFIYNYSNYKIKGLIFIMVRDDNSINTKKGELLYFSEITKTQIYIVYANKNFIDAGIRFMGDNNEEELFIEEIIKNTLM